MLPAAEGKNESVNGHSGVSQVEKVGGGCLKHPLVALAIDNIKFSQSLSSYEMIDFLYLRRIDATNIFVTGEKKH